MAESVAIWLPGVLAMCGLTVVSGFFSGSETALFYLSQEDLEKLSKGNLRQRLVIDLLNRPERLLTTILFGNLVINLMFFSAGILTARQLIAEGYEWVAGVINVAGVIGIIIFGEVIPKSLAVATGPTLAALVSVPIAAVARALDPILPTMAVVAAAMRRVRYPTIEPEPMLEPRDLDNAAKLTGEHSGLTATDARIFRNVLDLFDLTAEDVMWPRAHCDSLGKYRVGQDERSLLLAGDVVVDLRPDDEADFVAPIHRLAVAPAEIEPDSFQPLKYVPWSAPAVEAMGPLTDGTCLAVGVVNEYGDVIGFVAADDVLEPIVNPSASRAKRLLEREPIVWLDDQRVRVEGFTLLRVLAERLGLAEDVVEDDAGGNRTVAGLLHERLDGFAAVGDEIEWMDRLITVVKATARGEIVVEIETLEAGSTGEDPL